mgnify:CR=1 FL=1
MISSVNSMSTQKMNQGIKNSTLLTYNHSNPTSVAQCRVCYFLYCVCWRLVFEMGDQNSNIDDILLYNMQVHQCSNILGKMCPHCQSVSSIGETVGEHNQHWIETFALNFVVMMMNIHNSDEICDNPRLVGSATTRHIFDSLEWVFSSQ